eukprot:3403345-Amphidinium_carterae.1
MLRLVVTWIPAHVPICKTELDHEALQQEAYNLPSACSHQWSMIKCEETQHALALSARSSRHHKSDG